VDAAVSRSAAPAPPPPAEWRQGHGAGEGAAPLDAPPALPPLPPGLDVLGALPSATVMLESTAREYSRRVDPRLAAVLSSSQPPDPLDSKDVADTAGDSRAAAALADALIERLGAEADAAGSLGQVAGAPRGAVIPPPSWAWAGAASGGGGVLAMEAELAAELAAGEGATLAALSRYLRCLPAARLVPALSPSGLGRREARLSGRGFQPTRAGVTSIAPLAPDPPSATGS
jgi:hypothetical protein